MTTTKRERERRLEQVEQAVESATDDAGEWSVEHRDAAPDKRPQGLAVDTEARTIRYDFWHDQRECLDRLEAGEHDIVAFLGGYRSGKSVTGARWVLTEAVCHPGARFLAMGTTYSEAVDATYRVLFEQLPGERTHIVTGSFNGPEHSPIVADYNRAEHRLTLVNDAVIVLGSGDKWSRYAGDEYAGVWLDEPSHYGNVLYDLLEMISTRLTASSGPKVQFWSLTGNGYNAAWSVLEKQVDVDGEPLGHNIELQIADVADNPYLSEGDIERLERQYAGTGREEQALRGGFEAAKGLVYTQFNRDTHVIEHAKAHDLVDDTEEWRIYGYDAGWRDPRAMLEVGKTAYGQLVVLDEFCESETHVEDAIRWLQTHDKLRGPIFAEHEPSDIVKFKRADYPATKAEKSLDSGIAEVRHRLEADTEDRVGLLISDRCGQLIRELHGYQREQVGTKAATDHLLDCLRYLCMGVRTADAYHERQQKRKERKEQRSGVSYIGSDSETARPRVITSQKRSPDIFGW